LSIINALELPETDAIANAEADAEDTDVHTPRMYATHHTDTHMNTNNGAGAGAGAGTGSRVSNVNESVATSENMNITDNESDRNMAIGGYEGSDNPAESSVEMDTSS
jgi:hypothetical protein